MQTVCVWVVVGLLIALSVRGLVVKRTFLGSCSPRWWKRSVTKATATDTNILKRIDNWACIKNCGACCKLGPLSSRPDLQDYLSKDDYDRYVSMIGEDDWCKNYDKDSRSCTIYESRPTFCRVDPTNFEKMFGIEPEEFTDFCTFCCTENIRDVYGDESTEMETFSDTILQLEEEEEGFIIDPNNKPLEDEGGDDNLIDT